MLQSDCSHTWINQETHLEESALECNRCGLHSVQTVPGTRNKDLAEIENLRTKLSGALAERDHYQNELHKANELKNQMTSAAVSAADSTIKAIDRIQEMEKVVKAAESWAVGGSHAALTDAVKFWQNLKKKWS